MAVAAAATGCCGSIHRSDVSSAPMVGVDLVTRFCGGPVDSESSVFALNGEIVGCSVAFACPFFVLVARCNVGFVLAELDIHIKY